MRRLLLILMCFWLHSVEAISGASYDSKSFSFSGQASQGAGIEFSPDGTKHYVTNGSGNIYQYTCSTAWDASTCTYASKTCNATAQTGSSHTVIFNATGTKMYTNSNTNQYQYSLSSAYDISTCSYDSVTLSTAAQDGSTYESKWSSDGTKYYVLGVEFDKVYQYSCSSAYSLSSCTYSKFLSVATQELYPWGLEIRSDGKKVYVSGGNETIYRYGCTTAWEMDTCTYDSDSYSVSSTVGGIYATGLVFKPDGTKMYVSGWTSGNNVYQFSTAETWPSAAPASIGLGFGGFF